MKMNPIIVDDYKTALNLGKHVNTFPFKGHLVHRQFYIKPLVSMKGKRMFLVIGEGCRVCENTVFVFWCDDKRRWVEEKITAEDVEDMASEMAALTN